MTLSPGSKFGSYEILAPIGAGGMGEVYKAKDTKLNRVVAVKVLSSELADAEARRVPILDRPAEENDVKTFPLPTVRGLMPRFGGKRLFYVSSIGSGDGLWRNEEGQSLEIWKGADSVVMEPPAVAADGSRVAFVVRRNGRLVYRSRPGMGPSRGPLPRTSRFKDPPHCRRTASQS